jgi:two-component system nitrate/nitrite response regulator NarL
MSLPTGRSDALKQGSANAPPRPGVPGAARSRVVVGYTARPAAAVVPAPVPMPMPRAAVTVAIAGGSAAGRAAWKRAVLEPCVAAEVDSIDGLRQLLVARQPAVLLLDAELPGLNGPAGLSALRQVSPELRSIVLGNFRSDREELAFFRAGARACCRAGMSLVLLARAIDAVLRGEVWIRRALTGSLVTELAALEAAGAAAARSLELAASVPGRVPGSLTARERQVASLLARGDSNAAIAQRLSISERTVAAHASRILRKSGAGDRAGLVALLGAHEAG